MDSGSLVDLVSSDQSQTFVFSITFSSESWCKFWRLLITGCAMSDCLYEGEAAHLAATWDQLSAEIATLLTQTSVKSAADTASQYR